jgi:hypothetical protein
MKKRHTFFHWGAFSTVKKTNKWNKSKENESTRRKKMLRYIMLPKRSCSSSSCTTLFSASRKSGLSGCLMRKDEARVRTVGAPGTGGKFCGESVSAIHFERRHQKRFPSHPRSRWETSESPKKNDKREGTVRKISNCGYLLVVPRQHLFRSAAQNNGPRVFFENTTIARHLCALGNEIVLGSLENGFEASKRTLASPRRGWVFGCCSSFLLLAFDVKVGKDLLTNVKLKLLLVGNGEVIKHL